MNALLAKLVVKQGRKAMGLKMELSSIEIAKLHEVIRSFEPDFITCFAWLIQGDSNECPFNI